MALRKNYTLPILYNAHDIHMCERLNLPLDNMQYVNVSDAYIRINEIKGNKYAINMSVIVYDSTISTVLDKKEYTMVPSLDDNSHNFLKQGYEFLKTLSDYEDAIDVLEE